MNVIIFIKQSTTKTRESNNFMKTKLNKRICVCQAHNYWMGHILVKSIFQKKKRSELIEAVFSALRLLVNVRNINISPSPQLQETFHFYSR